MKSLSQKINESLNESSEDKQAYGEVRSFSEFQKSTNRPDYLLIDKTSNKIVAGFARMNVPKAGQKDYMNKNHQLISTSSAKNPAPYLDQKPIDYDNKKNWVNESVNESVTEALSEKDLKANKTYLVKKGKIEAYAEYKSSKDGKHFFDNSGEMIEISDSELGKCVVNESVYATSVLEVIRVNFKEVSKLVRAEYNIKMIAFNQHVNGNSFIEFPLDKKMETELIQYLSDNDVTAKSVKVNKAVTESVNESEITTDEQFKEYVETVLKEAHGDDYDQDKADKTAEGILKDADGDYGTAVGMLTSSLGESLHPINTQSNDDGISIRTK